MDIINIKDNLSKIGKYIEDGASNAALKSSNFVEISKLNIAISSKEKRIQEIYIKIGEKIYKDFKEGKINNKNIIDKCKEIEEIEKEISSLKKKILKIKDKKNCKNCGLEIDKNAEFCPKCGKEQKA
ncbi:zinc-ribbon domain-containing protein [Clostridium sp. USBA 49]|uniref:zinc ribbon domain-containing protein n=1 Tax=Clostridium TaxID=1485 RepID=UPI00099927CA|nr:MULTISPECIES: zinc ribbon domain-containing protein [Clostridium]SKA88896.1 zinc-ribbon domain-containing protein [Clostridium sp. USBA 49]